MDVHSDLLVVSPKSLHKIKLEDVIAIFTLSPFLAEVKNLRYKFSKL